MRPSPLIDVAIGYVREAKQDPIPEEYLSNIRTLFEQYIYNGDEIAEASLRQELISTIGDAIPLDKIEAILHIDDSPLPKFPIFDPQDPNRRKTHPWSKVEDYRLLAAIHRYGLDNWNLVAKFIGNGRSRAQCSQRWARGLDPRIAKTHWSEAEENMLCQLLMSSQCKNWTQVATMMGNRSDVQCRYHFLQMQRNGKIDKNIIPVFSQKYANNICGNQFQQPLQLTRSAASSPQFSIQPYSEPYKEMNSPPNKEPPFKPLLSLAKAGRCSSQITQIHRTPPSVPKPPNSINPAPIPPLPPRPSIPIPPQCPKHDMNPFLGFDEFDDLCKNDRDEEHFYDIW